MAVLYVRIPDDRIGVLIGTKGETKRRIESRTGTTVSVDREDGTVEVVAPDDGDPVGLMKARDVALAIGRGFAPARAERLLRDDTYLGVIDIKQISGKHEKAALWRIRSRLIGVNGRARSRIEELSGCSMSVYGSTVALIGQERQLERATRAIELLLHGSEHAAVFHLLARLRRDDAQSEATADAEEPDSV
ncbi:MAG TPA: KH domain-containing protein [Thermoplasmata archaeon]|nr:KH domain-containing protein [Thermoplasmata archaeon]